MPTTDSWGDTPSRSPPSSPTSLVSISGVGCSTSAAVLAAGLGAGEASSPLSLFWEAVRELDPEAPGEADLPGTRRGHLAELLYEAGMTGIVDEP